MLKAKDRKKLIVKLNEAYSKSVVDVNVVEDEVIETGIEFVPFKGDFKFKKKGFFKKLGKQVRKDIGAVDNELGFLSLDIICDYFDIKVIDQLFITFGGSKASDEFRKGAMDDKRYNEMVKKMKKLGKQLC